MLLDCTLRDGGYYTNWEYQLDLIKDLILFHYKYSNIAFEFGYFNLNKIKEFKGICAESPCDYLDFIFKKFTQKNSWGDQKKVFAMVNSKELVETEYLKQISVIKNTKKSLFFNGIRIATEKSHFKEVLNFAKAAKKEGIFTIINLMKIDEISNNQRTYFIEELRLIDGELRPDVIYLADSYGSLYIDETKKIINFFYNSFNELGIEVGFHAHNNKGLALANTFEAINCGASWFDGSWLGMGRGAGNAELEHLILNCLNIKEESIKYQSEIASDSQELLEKYFVPLKNKYNWGKNIFYDLSGSVRLHPTKCLDLINTHKLSLYSKAFSIISSDKKTTSDENQTSILEKSIFSKFLNQIPILIYSGDSSLKNIESLNYLRRTKNFFLIRINYSSILNKIEADFMLTSSTERLIQFLAEDSKETDKLKCLVPDICIKKSSQKINKREIYQYKSPLEYKYSIEFALDLLTANGFHAIKVIGLDGKRNLTLKDKEEFQNTEKIIKNYSDKIIIESLTNTPHSIPLTPIYSVMN